MLLEESQNPSQGVRVIREVNALLVSLELPVTQHLAIDDLIKLSVAEDSSTSSEIIRHHAHAVNQLISINTQLLNSHVEWLLGILVEQLLLQIFHGRILHVFSDLHGRILSEHLNQLVIASSNTSSFTFVPIDLATGLSRRAMSPLSEDVGSVSEIQSRLRDSLLLLLEHQRSGFTIELITNQQHTAFALGSICGCSVLRLLECLLCFDSAGAPRLCFLVLLSAS